MRAARLAGHHRAPDSESDADAERLAPATTAVYYTYTKLNFNPPRRQRTDQLALPMRLPRVLSRHTTGRGRASMIFSTTAAAYAATTTTGSSRCTGSALSAQWFL